MLCGPSMQQTVILAHLPLVYTYRHQLHMQGNSSLEQQLD